MGIKTTVTSDSKNLFKPITLNVQIVIDTKESLKDLQEEFKYADLENECMHNHDGDYELSTISSIVKQIEKEL